jgi:hypothetical protein
MILEETQSLKINNIMDFSYKPDPDIDIEGEIYPGDTGQVFDLTMIIGERPARILLFDSEFGRNELLTGRFIYGKEARRLYSVCTNTVARTLMEYYPEILGEVENAREHQILRAGKAISIAPFIKGLKTQGDDFKRQPLGGSDMYQAACTGEINWGSETVRIFSDICPASGSTMEAFVKKAISETEVSRFIFNCSTSTINALYRVIPAIPSEIEVVVIYWEALFSVWRNDVVLPDGQTIHAGTIINLNPDDEFPRNNPIAPGKVQDYIYRIFQRDRVSLLPDVAGEVGEKIQEEWVEPLSYDFLEFCNSGIDLTREPWREKAEIAWKMEGVKEHLKSKAPEVYERLVCAFENTTDEGKSSSCRCVCNCMTDSEI